MNPRHKSIRSIQDAVNAIVTAKVDIGNLDESATLDQIVTAQRACTEAMLKCSEAAGDLSEYRTFRSLGARSDSEIALDGAVNAMLACGDLELDDEPVPAAAHNDCESDLCSEGPRPRTPTSLDAMVVGLAMIDKAMKQGPRPPDATDY